MQKLAKFTRSFNPILLALLLTGILSACGGGGSSGGDDDSSQDGGSQDGGGSGSGGSGGGTGGGSGGGSGGGAGGGGSGGGSGGGGGDNPVPAEAPVSGFDPPAPAMDGEPVLLFSDLDKGPTGAFVTIWAQNLPASPNLTCGNQACDLISMDFDLNHPAHGRQPAMQKIVVRFYEGSDISVQGGNTLPYEVTDGEIIELNPGTINISSADWGDVVYLHGGTYSQTVNCAGANALICGNGNSGVAVVGYPGETAVLDCGSSSAFDAGDEILSDFTIANLEMDCQSSGRAMRASRIGGRWNLRVIGNYVHDARSSNSGALGEFSTTINLYILGNRIENTGVPGENNAHAIYHGGRGESRNVHISFNRIDTHLGGRAIQIFGHREGESMTELVIRGNHISNSQGNASILVSHSDGPSGLPPDAPEKGWIDDALVDYNTVHDGGGAGIDIRNAGVDAVINQNIIYEMPTAIRVDFAESAEGSDNCMDSNINSDITFSGTNNETDYPACL